MTVATDRILVLTRHGQSAWNLSNLFTGWNDVDLTDQGIEQAKAAGRKLLGHNIRFDVAFTSNLKRAPSPFRGGIKDHACALLTAPASQPSMARLRVRPQ